MKHKILPVVFLLFASLTVWAQSLTVTGVVMAQDEPDPVIGANVMVKGTTNGTITDFDGNFSLQAKVGDVLQVSFMGYKAQDVKVSSTAPIRVTLEPDNVQLQEVVAIGYGTMKKSDLTGAVSSVRAEDLQKTPMATVDQALQGKAAGVTVNANSGQPGAAAEIRIRGIGSVKSESTPIYVVDGVVLKDINFLTPSDIESMEIMKDASSTAIYGSQAANGVILITTKSGHTDRKAAISFNAYWGIQNRWRKLDVMNAMDQAQTEVLMAGGAKAITNWNKGFATWWQKTNNASGTNPYYPVNFDYAAHAATGGTDWQDEVFHKNALVHNYSLSIDGGGEWGSYLFSASYFNQDGTLHGSNYERLTLRVNSNFNVRKWLRIGENLSFSTSRSRNAMNNNASPQASVLSAALAMAPWDPVYYPDYAVNGLGESIGGQPSAASNFTNVVNPMSMIFNTEPNNKVQRWVGDIFIEIKPVEGLTIRPSLSMDLSNNMDRTFNYAYRYSNADYREHNSVGASMARYMTLTNDNVITYARDIQKHSFSIMAGETMQQYNYYSVSAGGQDIVNIDPKNWYIFNTKNDSTRTEGDAVARTRRLLSSPVCTIVTTIAILPLSTSVQMLLHDSRRAIEVYGAISRLWH
ncbi:MAG: SusC/RagA family TonB-linked outer membrane protein [Paludibacteraceae bacterium]|nr:SusC/RagA family TonB-linked outer membrane protein [Paludibacteraceae bacterium]